MSSSSAQGVLASAMAVLNSTSDAQVPDEASGVLGQLEELVELRARVVDEIARASRSTDVIVTNLLADQLRECLRDVDRRLHAATAAAEKLLRRSA